MSLLYSLLTLLTFTLLLADALIYPAFSFVQFRLDAVMVLIIYMTVSLLIGNAGLRHFPAWVTDVNKRLVFPLLLGFALIFVLWETVTYDNAVFSFLHLHPFSFLYLPIASGIIITASHLKEERSHALLFVPPILLLTFSVISLTAPDLFRLMSREDGVLEYAQFALYLLAALYAFRAYRTIGSPLFLLLAAVLFFTAGEEISWGQRLLGIATPSSLTSVNVQNETTIHNLRVFQELLPVGYIAVGLYGAFSRLIAEKVFRLKRKMLIYTPPYVLFLPFFIVALFYYQNSFGLYGFAGVTGLPDTLYPQDWQEAIETFLAFGLLGYAFYTSHENHPKRMTTPMATKTMPATR